MHLASRSGRRTFQNPEALVPSHHHPILCSPDPGLDARELHARGAVRFLRACSRCCVFRPDRSPHLGPGVLINPFLKLSPKDLFLLILNIVFKIDSRARGIEKEREKHECERVAFLLLLLILSLAFHSLTVNSVFILPGFVEPLGCVDLCLSSNLGSFLPIFLQISFFFLSFWDSHDMYIAVMVSQRSLRLCSFVCILFFLSVSQMDCLNVPSFRFTEFFLHPAQIFC